MYQIMGILNVTPDSFYDGGRGNVIDHALKLINEGAHIIDVGGESTRPGAKKVSQQEELDRVIPVISRLAKESLVKISIDTTKAEVARQALEVGASIINDVSGFTMDPAIVKVAAHHKATVILTHIQGTPRTMQQNPTYQDVVKEVYAFFKQQLSFALSQGCQFSQFILDPGIGFGKTLEHNLQILNSIDTFLSLECPLLVGVSRKSFIGKIQNDSDPHQRLSGSLSAAVWAYLKGVTYFRVHDVLETKRALNVVKEINSI